MPEGLAGNMPFVQHPSGVRFYSFDIFPDSVIQAVFTRQGGVSPAPWDTLNVGGTVGDEAARVRENRLRCFAAVKRSPESLFHTWQVHSADVACAEAPQPAHLVDTKADIILTDNPQVTLFMRFADCVPILLHDPKRSVVGIAHAGWLGTLRDAAGAAIRAMQQRYGSKPQDVLAAIGPSIGVDHYEVGSEVIAEVERVFGSRAEHLIQRRDGRGYFDLWNANRILLQQAGVKQIEIAGICTACHLDDWFSHRAEKGKTGRFGALIALGSR